MKRLLAATLLLVCLCPTNALARRLTFTPGRIPTAVALPPASPAYAARNGFKQRLAAMTARWSAARKRAGERLRMTPVVRACAGGAVGLLHGVAKLGGLLGRVAAGVSGIGSLALAAHAGMGVVTARSTDQRLDALGDLGQGMCGIARLGYVARPLVHSLGTIGAGLQCGAGVCEIYGGIRNRDRDKIILGALDVGAGVLFGASALSMANPLTLVAALAVTGARFLYAKRKGIASGWDRLCERVRTARAARAERRAQSRAVAAGALPGAVDTTAARLELPAKIAPAPALR